MLSLQADGSARLEIKPTAQDPVGLTIHIGKPWAYDSVGRPIKTWYEVSGTSLVQYVDGRAAQGHVTFDPTYTALDCAGHWADLDAYWYLSIAASDIAYCPVMGMFIAANSYTPVWGYEANVANDMGKVVVRQDGGWPFSPDTGWAWDFQVPCKAHDYCYDLRKASFSATVTDSDCDVWFFWLMEAHCNDRIFAQYCCVVRDSYYLAVSLPSVVTDPDPGVVQVLNLATLKCADVEGPSLTDGTPLQQWDCVGVANQKYRIWPAPGAPGFFQIKTTFSGSTRCARALTDPVIWTCQNWDSQRFQIRGALNHDIYSIRSKFHSSECWKVPNAFTNGLDLINPPCNDYSSWYLWRIVAT